jgi:parallel beta-helix repeat protein
LTIEPEVEVKFGGDFSLVVQGRLVADGAEDKMITFTSNRYEPEAGDWGAIEFNGIESSSLIHCIIEYGTNGISVENGTLNIQNSLVNLNSVSGIRIAGGNQVNVQNNDITSNGDGITLTGNATSEINIRQNEILLNGHSGILLEADNWYNTVIVNNTLSANSYGFYVSSNASTYITHNYVSNNTVGIFYGEGKNHRAYFNDIYDNSLGMDVYSSTDSEEIVKAEYNYWGDKDGPYHESLNPRGIGNPVGGNGVDLDFIFFLTAPIDHENTPPTAILWTDKTLVSPNQTVIFIGTDSYDEGRVDQYFFDFGDGTNSSWTTLSIFTHNYFSAGIYNPELAVKDDFGNKSDSATEVISVQNLTSLEASITLSNYTVNYNDAILVTVYVSDEASAVENANVTLFSVKGGSFTPLSGSTDPTGYFTTTFTAPNVTEITNIRIIGRASKTGYADGSDHKYVKVLPPLTVQVTAEPAAIKSEETTTVTIHVTAGFEQPVADVLLLLWSDYGNLSPAVGVTDVNGSATFLFTAPQTLSQIDVTITATAIKLGYAEEQGQGTITVEPKALVVEITADPAIIVSEAASTITAYVTCDSAPISDVTVTASSDSGGNFSTATETTDLNGEAMFVFSASQTTTMISATITVTAAKSGYVNGEGQVAITIVPKVLTVQATAKPNATVSEAKINVTVQVTYDMVSVPNASVTVTSENGGYFSATEGLTDLYGNATFIFTAPQVNEQSNITITVQASKIGYAIGENLLNITVNPGILSVEVRADPSTIMSSESTVVTVYAKCNETAVANASVTVLSSDGTFSVTNGTTDSEGYCILVFNAPRTTTQLSIIITANATKNGYISGQSETTISVTPETGGGWPLMTILLIIIPIAIVVIIFVLVKLKVITLSIGEES